MPTNWVYEIATGKWMLDFRDPALVHAQASTYAVATLNQDRAPDPVLERFDSATGQSRPATPAERAESRREQLLAAADYDFRRHPLLLAMALVIADLHDVTPAQIRAQVAEKYRQIRNGT